MKLRDFTGHVMRGSALFLLLCAGGCITLETQEDIAAQQAQQQALQQTIDRLKAQTESLLAQQDQLQQQIQTLRSVPQDRVTSADLQTMQTQLQNRIAELDRKIASVDAARAQDMQSVVNKVSGLIAAQGGRSTQAPVRPTSGGTKSSGSTKGGGKSSSATATQKAYEHEVAVGDTLSAIAAAYKVQASSIISANNLKDPGHLRVGQKLLIPAP